MWCKVERTDTTTGEVKLIDFGDGAQVLQDWHAQDMDETAAKAVHRLIGQAIDVSKEHIKACNALIAEQLRWAPRMPELADPDTLGPEWLTGRFPPCCCATGARGGPLPADSLCLGSGGLRQSRFAGRQEHARLRRHRQRAGRRRAGPAAVRRWRACGLAAIRAREWEWAPVPECPPVPPCAP